MIILSLLVFRLLLLSQGLKNLCAGRGLRVQSSYSGGSSGIWDCWHHILVAVVGFETAAFTMSARFICHISCLKPFHNLLQDRTFVHPKLGWTLHFHPGRWLRISSSHLLQFERKWHILYLKCHYYKFETQMGLCKTDFSWVSGARGIYQYRLRKSIMLDSGRPPYLISHWPWKMWLSDLFRGQGLLVTCRHLGTSELQHFLCLHLHVCLHLHGDTVADCLIGGCVPCLPCGF